MKSIVAALLVAELALAAPAGARLYTAVYTGTVSRVSDVTGVFFTPGYFSFDSGAAFTAVFTIDDTKGHLFSYSGGTELRGGYGEGTTVPLTGYLVINGRRGDVTQGLGNAYAHRDVAEDGSQVIDSVEGFIFDDDLFADDLLFLQAFDLPGVSPLLTNSTAVGGPIDVDLDCIKYCGSGSFQILRSVIDEAGSHFVRYAFGDLRPTHLTISAVPEPGTWALMLTGFGLAGATLRRRAYATPARYGPMSIAG